MDLQEPRNHGEWCERGHAALRVVMVLQHRAFSALVLRKIILYDRPKRERKAGDGAGVQPAGADPLLPSAHAQRPYHPAVDAAGVCRCSLSRAWRSLGSRRSLRPKRPWWARESTGPWQGVCATAPLWPMCAAVRACLERLAELMTIAVLALHCATSAQHALCPLASRW